MSPDQSDPGKTGADASEPGKPRKIEPIQKNAVKLLTLDNIKADWKNMGEKVRELSQKINQNVLQSIEKLEDLQYQNLRNTDAIKEKIEQDWAAFEAEIQSGMEKIKQYGQQRSERALQDLNAKKTEMQEQVKVWEKNYQEWSSKTNKKMKDTLASWGRFGWKMYLTFLVVAIPIVIIIVVLANALK